MVFRKLNFRGVSKETYDVLKSKILSGDLAPGQRIDVALVAEELGVSRTPVNDALQRLSVQGIVQIIPRKGTFVARVTPRDVEDMYELRMALEGKACELGARNMNSSKITALRKLNDRLSHDNNPVLSEHLRVNQEFHELIVVYSNNSMLLKAYAEVQARMQIVQVYFGFERWQDSSAAVAKQHDEIIEALASNHPSDAQRLMNEHIRGAMMRLISVIQVPKDSNGIGEPQVKTVRNDTLLVHS